MTTSSKWYYNAHNKGTFPHQKLLCDAVKWTKCNLEGQKIISSNHLSAIQGNPLTIRLLSLDEALELFNGVKEIEKKIQELSKENFKNKQSFTVQRKLEAEDSSLNTSGAPIESIETLGEHFELRYIDIHLALYEFFTNFGSIIDRLTYEINLLYQLNIPPKKIYWSTLTNIKCKYYETLKNKNVNLADLIVQYVDKFSNATKYRNRIVHDGMIKVDTNNYVLKFYIMLATDPDDDNSPMNVDAIGFLKKTKAHILMLLDKSYELMVQDIKSHGNPPW